MCPDNLCFISRKDLYDFVQKKYVWLHYVRQLLAGIKQKNLSHVFCYTLWRFPSYSGDISTSFSSSPVRWSRVFLKFNGFCCFSCGSYTHLILDQWHRWSPRIPHQFSLTSAGANCHTALKLDSPSPAGKKIKYPFADVKQTISKPASVIMTINSCALLKEKGSFSRTTFWWFVFLKNSFADSYFLVTLWKVICLSSEFIYVGRYTSKKVRIPSISFWSNQCLKATFKWTSHFYFCVIHVSMQGKQKGEEVFSPKKFLSEVLHSLRCTECCCSSRAWWNSQRKPARPHCRAHLGIKT